MLQNQYHYRRASMLKGEENLSWILNPTDSSFIISVLTPLPWHPAPDCNTTSFAMQLSLLLKEYTGNICQRTQASTFCLHTDVQPSPQLLHPTITPKQHRKFRKQQGQTQILFTPITDLPCDPAQAILPFHASALYQELMISNSTL